MDAAQVGVRRFRLQKDSMSKAITLCCGNALDELYSMVVKAFSTCFELSNACGNIRPLIGIRPPCWAFPSAQQSDSAQPRKTRSGRLPVSSPTVLTAI